MNSNFPLPQEKKLTVLFRVEPGSLGPDGSEHVGKFCDFAQKEFELIDSDFIHWEIVPRYDKSLPEMEYRVGVKILTHDKAEKYLKIFEKILDEFEDDLVKTLSRLIGQFLGH